MNIHSTGAALRRRDEIVRLVKERAVRSQEELASLLSARGFSVAQPTLSRDLRDLGLAKGPSGYVLPSSSAPAPDRRAAAASASWDQRLARVLDETVLSVVRAGTLVVLKTPPAQAHPIARILDENPLPGVAGTIAGDDTVFVATRDAAAAERVALRLRAPLSPPASARRGRARRGA